MVVGIKLNENGKTYYFNSNGFNLNEGDNVIVETEKGLQFGTVATTLIDESKYCRYSMLFIDVKL